MGWGGGLRGKVCVGVLKWRGDKKQKREREREERGGGEEGGGPKGHVGRFSKGDTHASTLALMMSSCLVVALFILASKAALICSVVWDSLAVL